MKSIWPKFDSVFSKVPEITIFFWVIKVLCTTVGETAADFLNVNLHFGLSGTSVVTGILLAIMMYFQFSRKRYIPSIYRLTVVLISVFGTLVTDNLTDALGVPLELSTIIFSILLWLIFLIWYLQEKTLSVHEIHTPRREAFYRLTILCTFALGTASGDLIAEWLWFWYLHTWAIIAIGILIFTIARKKWLNSILSFWLIYIFTRPLWASLWDFLSQSTDHGGLGLWATITSLIFLLAIAWTVIYLTQSQKDVVAMKPLHIQEDKNSNEAVMQTIITIWILIFVSLGGYYRRTSFLQQSVWWQKPANVQQDIKSFGDMSIFLTISKDTLALLTQNKTTEAVTRIADLEYEWDNAQAVLKAKDKTRWTTIDNAIDTVLKNLRAKNMDIQKSKTVLESLITTLWL